MNEDRRQAMIDFVATARSCRQAGMAMTTLRPEHQDRVVLERVALGEKLDRLDAFITGDVFAGIVVDEQARLVAQRQAMSIYAYFLDRRIEAFTT